jgi:UDP-glucose 4-epimerase
MRCLVTGAAGFIGSHLVLRLLDDGHQAVGLDDLSEGSLENLKGAGELELFEGDLRDEDVVRRASGGCDVIFHQAALRSVPRSMAAPGPTTDVNVRGTLNVLAAAREVGARVVFASSSSVYGDQREFPLNERQTPAPRSPYAASKLAGEVYCQTWWRCFAVPTVSLRYFNVYGPRQDALSQYAVVVPKFILACLSGTRPVIEGDGTQSRDFTFVEDVVEANLLAARAPDAAWGSSLNIGGGQQPTSINDLLAVIGELTEIRPDPIHVDPRPGDVYRTQADLSLAWDLIGYQPRTGIREGLRRTVDWFKTRDARAVLPG